MKKFICLLMVIMLVGACACGEAESADTTSSIEQEAIERDAYVFRANGVEVVMNAEAAPILEQLGEPVSKFESESCAFKGLDKEFHYPDFIIYTYPKDDVDYIQSVELKSDAVSTVEGITIGANESAVISVYGQPSGTIGSSGMQYNKGDSQLLIVCDEETGTTVQSIQYYAITDAIN